MMKYLLLFGIALSIAFVVLVIYNSSEAFRSTSVYEYPSKCFDCEKDLANRFGDDYAWMGQNTKSFASERALVQQTGSMRDGVHAHPLKYYKTMLY